MKKSSFFIQMGLAAGLSLTSYYLLKKKKQPTLSEQTFNNSKFIDNMTLSSSTSKSEQTFNNSKFVDNTTLSSSSTSNSRRSNVTVLPNGNIGISLGSGAAYDLANGNISFGGPSF